MATQANTGLARRRVTVRRGVIAALVLVCLALFTGYFRESDGGTLHGLQDTAGGVVAPVQEVAVAAIQPARDAWGWATDLRDARDRAASLEEENVALRTALVESRIGGARAVAAPAAPDLPDELAGYAPVSGRVIGRSSFDWYRSARLDVGTSDGVVRNSPVVVSPERGSALVGLVTSTTARTADVSFITDGRTQVGATIPEANSPPGLVESVTPGQLRLSGVPREYPVKVGQVVVTAGFSGLGLPSVYPRDLPVGQVTSVGRLEVSTDQAIQVKPFVDPRNLDAMIVLTPRSDAARERAEG
jgi:rod shape-determining protein MreC